MTRNPSIGPTDGGITRHRRITVPKLSAHDSCRNPEAMVLPVKAGIAPSQPFRKRGRFWARMSLAAASHSSRTDIQPPVRVRVSKKRSHPTIF